MCNYILKTKNINSKSIFKNINDFVTDGLKNAGVIWDSDIHRDSFVEIISEYVWGEFEDIGKVSQVNIICDHRNNTDHDMENGKYILDITYRQDQCLNVTQLTYIIHKK